MENALNNLIEKISSYEIFNNIIPGTIYAVLTEKLTSFSIKVENIFVTIILFYFVGLIINRMGSLVIHGLLKKINISGKPFLNFASYSDYNQAEMKDEKGRIRNLVTISNMYRTFAALSICIPVTIIIDKIWPYISENIYYKMVALVIGFILLTTLFIFSYRKQTDFITKKISHVINHKKETNENDRANTNS